MTPEGKLLAAFVKWLKPRGIPFVRLALLPGVKRGWPDLIVLLHGGRGLWVEMKRPSVKGRAAGVRSRQQDERHKELRDRGYDVVTCFSIDEATAAVTQAVDAARLPDRGG